MPLSPAIFTLIKARKLYNHPLAKCRTFSSQGGEFPRRGWISFFEDETETETETETESSVYKRALKFQRPPTVLYGAQPVNSVSLIGTISGELRRINPPNFGVHTVLNVKACAQSKRCFRVLLMMHDEMVEIAESHLKPNDFVYVWGQMGSYRKADKNGYPRMCYKVDVKEINYVTENAEKPTYREPSKLDSPDYLERARNRLHLWQVFFANPYEWTDNRRNKVNNPQRPDFKHKSTDEALWIRHDDPPWVKRQLQLLDSELVGASAGGRDSSFTSCWSLLGNDTLEQNEDSHLKYGA